MTYYRARLNLGTLLLLNTVDYFFYDENRPGT
jgi:hypothetical protein